MRKTAFAILILALAGAMAVAQTPASPSTMTPSDQIASNSPTTIQGCLAGKDGSFTLTDQKSGTVYKLSGSDDPLKDHVGHLIEVSGSIKGADNSADTTKPSPTFKVETTKMISDNCSASPSASASGEAAAVTPAVTPTEEKPAIAAAPVTPVVTEQPAAPAPAEPATTTAAMPPVEATAAPAAPAVTAQADVDAQASKPAPAATVSANEAKTGEELPQTASPLPLLGLLGFGSLLTGLIARFRK
jgi:hypothetical protein